MGLREAPATSLPKVTSVCIIGAGASGLAAAKYLVAERCFSRITIYEQGSNLGGLWNYVEISESLPENFHVPQTNPDLAPLQPIWHHDSCVRHGTSMTPHFLTSIYDKLESNIPRNLMGFSDLDWPDEVQLFPEHDKVLQYIEQYANDVRHLVEFRRQVVAVIPNAPNGWEVRTRAVTLDGSKSQREELFDAIIVANGHFNVPFIPQVNGMKEWNASYPGTITHSRYYRRSSAYTDRKVIVVGNSASGSDIASQIEETCKRPLIISSRSSSSSANINSRIHIDKPPILSFDVKRRSATFEDGSVESDIDAVVYCTGYLYSYPFLKQDIPEITSSGGHVQKTYQHMFFHPRPTMAFVGLNQKVIPFVVSESQSAIISRVFAGRLSLPAHEEMIAWEEEMTRARRHRDFHVLKFPEDASYINMLHDWAKTAANEQSFDICYRPPPYWNGKACWTREKFPEIKKAFRELNDERHYIKTIEELGFDFQNVM